MTQELIETKQEPLGDVARKARVQEALEAVGSSQRECAKALGLSDGIVSRVIAKLQRAHAETVEAWICERTGKTRQELFDGIAPVVVENGR